jgi:hypothetical protein
VKGETETVRSHDFSRDESERKKRGNEDWEKWRLGETETVRSYDFSRDESERKKRGNGDGANRRNKRQDKFEFWFLDFDFWILGFDF